MRMDFSEALFLMKAGRRVRRASWGDIWEWMEINARKNLFVVKYRDEPEPHAFDITPNSVLAEDWQEVEGETK